MRFIIHGAGAIGSVVGARLAQAGAEVVLIGRPAHVATIQRDGLTLISPDEPSLHLTQGLSAVTQPEHIRPRGDEVIFLCVKSAQTAESLQALRAVFPETTPIFCLQNGVRNEELAARRFLHVYAVMVEICAALLGPGQVAATRGELLSVGNYPRGCDETAQVVAARLRGAGYRVTTHDHAMIVKWSKLLLNLNNATHAILDTYVQLSFATPATSRFLAEVMAEGVRVLQAAGIDLLSEADNPLDVTAWIARLRGNPGNEATIAAARALPQSLRTYPSTWVDLNQQRGETEADYLNGEIIVLGQKHHIPTPYNATLLRIVQQMAADRTPPGKYSLKALQALVEAAPEARA